MNNGCICCTVRGDLIRILGALMRQRDRFDRILVETTGLADSAPVAQTFFADNEIGAKLRLDAARCSPATAGRAAGDLAPRRHRAPPAAAPRGAGLRHALRRSSRIPLSPTMTVEPS